MADETIRVKSALPVRPDGGSLVALYERDDRHPGDGEVYVAGDGVVEVAETPAVLDALRDGRLVRVERASAAPKAAEK